MNNRIVTLALAAAMTVAAVNVIAEPAERPSASATASAAQKYTCPMHPEVVQDKPGNCPKCGMKLVPKKDTGAKGKE